jgi:hypothetical protein
LPIPFSSKLPNGLPENIFRAIFPVAIEKRGLLKNKRGQNNTCERLPNALISNTKKA